MSTPSPFHVARETANNFSNSFKKVQLSKKAQLSSVLGGPHSEYYKSMTPMIEKLMHFSFFSAEKIAEKFKISVRTVYRDLKALSGGEQIRHILQDTF